MIYLYAHLRNTPYHIYINGTIFYTWHIILLTWWTSSFILSYLLEVTYLICFVFLSTFDKVTALQLQQNLFDSLLHITISPMKSFFPKPIPPVRQWGIKQHISPRDRDQTALTNWNLLLRHVTIWTFSFKGESDRWHRLVLLLSAFHFLTSHLSKISIVFTSVKTIERGDRGERVLFQIWWEKWFARLEWS